MKINKTDEEVLGTAPLAEEQILVKEMFGLLSDIADGKEVPEGLNVGFGISSTEEGEEPLKEVG